MPARLPDIDLSLARGFLFPGYLTSGQKCGSINPVRQSTGTEIIMSVTTSQIKSLSDEAGQAGDLEQVAICSRALDGDQAAWAECERVIADAQAQ